MKKNYILIIALLLSVGIQAQPKQTTDQYLLNNYALSPAYAGYNGNYEFFFTYRSSWVGLSGAPTHKDMVFNGPLTTNSGLGVRFQTESAGIFNDLNFAVDYAYRFKITDNQTISFGLGFQYFNNTIDFTNISLVKQNDPVINNADYNHANVLNADAGIIYHFNNFNVGFTANRLFTNQIKNSASNFEVFKYSPQYTTFAAGFYDINSTYRIEPSVVFTKPTDLPINYQVSLLVRYQRLVWAGLLFRNPGSIGFDIGTVVYKRISLNYSFETGGQTLSTGGQNTHEITFGFLIGNNKDTHNASIYRTDNYLRVQKWEE